MRKSEPTFIVMKRRIAGPEIVDPGMSFAAARKMMLHADGLDAGAPCPGSAGPEPTGPAESYEAKLAELRRLAGQLTEAVDDLAHAGPDQVEGEGEAEEEPEEETHGEERELS